MSTASSAITPRFEFALPNGDRIDLRPLDLDLDVSTLHSWFNQEHGRFWGLMGHTLEQVRQGYQARLQHPGTEVLIGELASSGQRLFLTECYDPRFDEVGRLYDVQPGDRGFHMFVAPLEKTMPALTYWIFQATLERIFADAAVQRIIGEPDVLNARVFARLRQAGFELGPVVQLRYKTGQMVYLRRADFTRGRSSVPPGRDDYPGRARSVRWQALAGRIRRKLASLMGH